MERKNPETPREGVEETRRDLDNLRSEVVEWEQSAENESTIVDSTEQLETDAEVKSGFEKILNKSFEKTISDFEKELPNDFTVDDYMKSIAEKHPELWMFISTYLWLPSESFLWVEPNLKRKFNKLETRQKINFIALKKAIDKLTSWGKILSEVSYEEITKEIWEQSKELTNNVNKHFEWKPLSTLKWLWLTDKEFNKIWKLLRQKWLLQEISQWTSDGEEIINWEDGTIITEKKRGVGILGCLVIWGICAALGVGGGYLIRWRDDKPSSIDRGNSHLTSPVETRDVRSDMLRVPVYSSGTATFRNVERRFPWNTFWQDVKNAFWTDYVDIQCSSTLAAGFKGSKTHFKKEGDTLYIDTDKPTVYCLNTEGNRLKKWWSFIKIWSNKNVETHCIKLCENEMLMAYAWYRYNRNTKKLVIDDETDENGLDWRARQELLLKQCKESLIKEYKAAYQMLWIKKVVVRYNPSSNIKICLEDKNRWSLPNGWSMPDRPRPWKDDTAHYEVL